MKNNLNLSVPFFLLTILCLTNCTKVNTTFDNEQAPKDIQTAIIGSWQVAEKGVEIAMHDGHICPDPQNMPQNQVTYVVQWEKIASDEKRDFKKNGEYNSYLKSAMTCSGTYNLTFANILEWDTNCEKSTAKVEKVTASSMIIKQGSNYYKYQKLD